jgi:hypothetical protein
LTWARYLLVPGPRHVRRGGSRRACSGSIRQGGLPVQVDPGLAGCAYDTVMAGRGRAGYGLAAAVLGCSVALSAACSAAAPAAPGRGAAPRAAVGTLAAGPARRALAARYLVIAKAGNRPLDAGFGRLDGRDRNRLAAADADLRSIAATERLFDRGLLNIAFPPGIEQVAHALYRVNQARAELTSAAAASTSLSQLHAYELRLNAANGPVEQDVRTLRRLLGLPSPSTS